MRYQSYLKDRYQAIAAYSGAIFVVIGALFLVPLSVIPFYPEEAQYAGGFLLTSALLMVPGLILWRRFRVDSSLSLTVQEGMVIVVLVWSIVALVGALPFMLILGLNFTQGVFESTSGWTTTGLSVVDVTTAPRIVLFYRSFIQLAGGAGFAIIALSAVTGPVGAGLSLAEGRGDLLAPHVRESTKIVLRIYIAYMIFGIVALYLAGMGWFDAINHAFTALATGGFSTRPESIGYWNDPIIEGVVILLMLLGALNFLTAYTLFRGKFTAVVKNGELRLQTVVLLSCILFLLVLTTTQIYPEFTKALRTAIFEAASALSGTGFSTVSYSLWNEFSWLILIGLMTVGGGSGSTAGGLKQFRVYLLYKATFWEYRKAFMPQHSVNEPAFWQGEQRSFLSDELVRRVALYVFLYLLALFIGTAMVAAHGYALSESLFEFASSLGTVGLSVGVTQPDAPASLMWVQIVGMFLGRLEFFAVIIGLSKLILDARTMVILKSSQERTRI